MRKGKIERELKIEYVEKYKAGKISINNISARLGVHPETVLVWVTCSEALWCFGHQARGSRAIPLQRYSS